MKANNSTVLAAQVRSAMLRWYRKNGRDLPWRRTHEPYAILVSEFMLQQTQVASVVPYYDQWLRRFPTLPALADANEEQVLHAWQGLGYYSRARNLHRCARIAVNSGGLPREPERLRKLPGIGRYTANAVAVFAFNNSLPLVEANSARVLARIHNVRERIDSARGRRRLWIASAELVANGRARNLHSAIMDLGALVCTARNPRCHICPVKRFCAAPDPHNLPRKRAARSIIHRTENHQFVRRGRMLLLERCRTRWRGMWMLPSSAALAARAIYRADFPFTHHRVTLEVFAQKRRRARPYERWFEATQLHKVPLPSPHRRAIASLLLQDKFARRRDSSTSLVMTQRIPKCAA